MSTKRNIVISMTFALLLIGIAPAALAAFGVSFSTSIDTTTTIPGGTGTFSDFVYAPTTSDGAISFMGAGTNGQLGLYYKHPTDPYRLLVDLNTAIPGGIGNFINLTATDPCISGDLTVFLGEGSGGQVGVYVKRPGDPYRIIADRNTAIPDGSGNFTGFLPIDLFSPSVSGDNVVFYGSGESGQQGIYVQQPGDPCRRVADLNTPIPDGTGNFTTFYPTDPILPPSPIVSGDAAAFIGFGSGFQTGIYRYLPPSPILPDGSLTTLANTNTLIPGSSNPVENKFRFFRTVSMDGTNVAFVGGVPGVVTSDGDYTGQEGVYKDIGSGWQLVADLNVLVPGSSAHFALFRAVAISDVILTGGEFPALSCYAGSLP